MNARACGGVLDLLARLNSSVTNRSRAMGRRDPSMLGSARIVRASSRALTRSASASLTNQAALASRATASRIRCWSAALSWASRMRLSATTSRASASGMAHRAAKIATEARGRASGRRP